MPLFFFKYTIACSAHDSKRHTELPQYMLLLSRPKISQLVYMNQGRAATLSHSHTNEVQEAVKIPFTVVSLLALCHCW